MTENDRQDIIAFKKLLDQVAKQHKVLADRGYHFGYNIDGGTGTVISFNAQQLISLNLDAKVV